MFTRTVTRHQQPLPSRAWYGWLTAICAAVFLSVPAPAMAQELVIDNFHYARNIRLPGLVTDLYKVQFFVNPPDDFALARHRDWLDNYGDTLIPEPVMFSYDTVDFRAIATAPPRQ